MVSTRTGNTTCRLKGSGGEACGKKKVGRKANLGLLFLEVERNDVVVQVLLTTENKRWMPGDGWAAMNSRAARALVHAASTGRTTD